MILGCGGGSIGLTYCQSVLILLLLLSSLADLKTDRIPNGFILLGILTGISGSVLSGRSISDILASVFLAFLLLYPLFRIGAFGAGDVKLFVLIGRSPVHTGGSLCDRRGIFADKTYGGEKRQGEILLFFLISA